MSYSDTFRFLALRTLGNFLVLLALYGVVMTFGPALSFEFQYQVIRLRHIHFTIENPAVAQNANNEKKIATKTASIHPSVTHTAPSFADILAGNQQQMLMPIDPLFSILIPKLGIDEKVTPNVDPNDPSVYLPILQHSVAHAKGSVLPGDPGIIYLFAHSTDNWWDVGRYNAVFYTLSNLSLGDDIVIFYDNRRYTYSVSEQLISDPEDTTLLTSEHSGPSELVLQTCWPPGTSFKRLYVIAKQKRI